MPVTDESTKSTADAAETPADAPAAGVPPTGPADGGDGHDGPDDGSPLPGAAPGRVGWPTWVRRSIIAVALVGCAVLLVWVNSRADVGTPERDRDPAIVAQFPAPGSRALRQTTVGAELKAGYDGRLTINGVAIPEAEMEGARDPAAVDPVDLAQNGLRPNNRNRVFFTPGPGKSIETFDTGSVIIQVQYFRERRATSTGRTVSWTIAVA